MHPALGCVCFLRYYSLAQLVCHYMHLKHTIMTSDKGEYGFDNTSYMMFYAHSQIELHGNSCLNIYGKCFHYKMTAESWSRCLDFVSAV